MKSHDSRYDAGGPRSVDVSRRKFLAASAVGVTGLGAVGSAAAAPDEHTLVIAGSGTKSNYSFTVGGDLEKSTADGATIDGDATITGNSAHGLVGSGKDAYTFTGPLYSFDFDESSPIDVDLDGQAANVGQRPDHTIAIEGTGPEASYSFATDGTIESSDAYSGDKNPIDRINAHKAAGRVFGGTDAYTYYGDLIAFDLDGNAEVTIDGEPARVGRRPDHRMLLFLEDPTQEAEYEITTGGLIDEVLHDDQSGDTGGDFTIGGNTIAGSISGASYDEFTFYGDIVSFDTDNPDALEAYSNYEKLY